ncbi:MAG TPA: hypothetical protein VKB89_28495 [Xanthobacteraceae bacterium]|nr:hypothetical protein [Xanthobacteraceae bacterium]
MLLPFDPHGRISSMSLPAGVVLLDRGAGIFFELAKVASRGAAPCPNWRLGKGAHHINSRPNLFSSATD